MLEKKEMNEIFCTFSKFMAFFELDADGCITSANKNFLKLLDICRADIIGSECKLFWCLEGGAKQEIELWNKIRRGNMATYRSQCIRKTDAWVSIEYLPIFTDQGDLSKVFCIAKDVSADISTQEIRDLK